MKAALGLAWRGLGLVWPNPSVGCVLVNDGVVVGRGWTQMGGRPHAETEALARAGDASEGATAYVSLEPCAHYGKTPPCADALIAGGIARAVIAVEDPDPRTAGQGIDKLRRAGIKVDVGLLAEEARDLNIGFFKRVSEGRPFVTLKTATTLDGRIATHTGESQWITSEPSRATGHQLRALYDAVMVGVGTVAADDPSLDCRLPGMSHASPVRIVMDSRLRIPLTSKLVSSAGDIPTWIVTLEDEVEPGRLAVLEECGVKLIKVPPGADGKPDIAKTLAVLGELGLTRLLLEGGAHLTAAFLRQGMIDRLAWFHAPKIMGGDGMPVAMPFGIENLDAAPKFTRRRVRLMGNDIFESYDKE
jgi:diaminohydroxyphosphoribosylaminopyrimidine deaminase/5-amino-6-(5-phosphoribosylamino)uracil reductase